MYSPPKNRMATNIFFAYIWLDFEKFMEYLVLREKHN
jgi:hypothetical protein